MPHRVQSFLRSSCRLWRLQIHQRTPLILVALVALSTLPVALQGQWASPLVRNPQSALVVHTVDGAEIRLNTVVVSDLDDLRHGLMHVKHLPLNLTMTFLYRQPRTVSMWMKDTYIPLDMWWVDTNMTVRHIKQRTTPLSLESLLFDRPVRAVIEINGGLSRLLGVTEGARIEFSDTDN